MNAITHRQAKRYLRADLDGLLNDVQRRALETHLAGCEACRAESQSLSSLTSRLQTEFRARWDAQDGPSERVLINIQSRSRRIIMSNRIKMGFNLLGGVVALLALFFVANWAISNFQKDTASETQTNNSVSSLQDERLLAFTSQQDGNYEIYTIYPDGSNKRNITNNAAYDANPFWSPDGKHIAFQSDRNSVGNYSQIFLMDADGANVVLLTMDKGDYQLPLNIDGKVNPWSPDDRKLLYLRKGPSENDWLLEYIDIQTGEITSLADGRLSFSHVSWSPDGKHISFMINTSSDPNTFAPQVYIINADATDLVNISELLPVNETFSTDFGWNDHAWSGDGGSFFFVASNAPVSGGYSMEGESGNSVYWKIYEVGLTDRSLVAQATTRSPVGGFWNGSYFVIPIMGPGNWTWVHPDGSVNTINPTKECEQERLYHAEDNSYTNAVANFSQSPNGNGIIIATCPDGVIHLSWVNSTETQVSPVARLSTAPMVDYLDGASWSQDDRFIAFRLAGSNETYIMNIADALKDPTTPLVKIILGADAQYYNVSWQPAP